MMFKIFPDVPPQNPSHPAFLRPGSPGAPGGPGLRDQTMSPTMSVGHLGCAGTKPGETRSWTCMNTFHFLVGVVSIGIYRYIYWYIYWYLSVYLYVSIGIYLYLSVSTYLCCVFFFVSDSSFEPMPFWT